MCIRDREQIEQFLKEHPQTKLIVIDTLQRIRTAGNDANPYASDYRDVYKRQSIYSPVKVFFPSPSFSIW